MLLKCAYKITIIPATVFTGMIFLKWWKRVCLLFFFYLLSGPWKMKEIHFLGFREVSFSAGLCSTSLIRVSVYLMSGNLALRDFVLCGILTLLCRKGQCLFAHRLSTDQISILTWSTTPNSTFIFLFWLITLPKRVIAHQLWLYMVKVLFGPVCITW